MIGIAVLRVICCFLLGIVASLPAAAAQAAGDLLPRPAALERDVQFWIRVYSEISTNEGFLHDDRNLGVVYRKLTFEPGVTARARRDAVDRERNRIKAMLRRLAAGAADLSADEQRIAQAFGSEASPRRFATAVDAVRFQLGQADRFRAGVERSGTWETHIARTFAAMGLPPELAALPHVESSFNPGAWSKVGAAGLWQFMPATGRRYLRIDDAVDERMDPFRATEAAAQLLDYNYRLLGSWPLALTAYNHGAAGMRRARDAMGTSDITTIVRGYSSRSFGFASRNFYVSFLAALEIDRDPARYFSGVHRRAPMQFTEVELPAYVPLASLARAVGVGERELLRLNPALLPPVADGQRHVPAGYRLRLPTGAGNWTAATLSASLGPGQQHPRQRSGGTVKVAAGDTLSGIARRHGVTVQALARLNGLDVAGVLRQGRTLQLPAPAAPPAPVASASRPAPEPVTAAQEKADGPALAPVVEASAGGDPTDYAVAADGTIRVAAGETLGHVADWLGTSAARLRALNAIRPGRGIAMGQVLKLDFAAVAPAQFEARRVAWHQQLQAGFFAAHRIVGTHTYVTRPGDSLWQVMQRNEGVPSWLLQQYNPEVDFTSLRAGVSLVIPRVQALSVA